MAQTSRHRFGRAGLCILTALPVCASSAQLLERYEVKTTLAFMVDLIPRSGAHRQTTLLLSGVWRSKREIQSEGISFRTKELSDCTAL